MGIVTPTNRTSVPKMAQWRAGHLFLLLALDGEHEELPDGSGLPKSLNPG